MHEVVAGLLLEHGITTLGELYTASNRDGMVKEVVASAHISGRNWNGHRQASRLGLVNTADDQQGNDVALKAASGLKKDAGECLERSEIGSSGRRMSRNGME